MIWIPVTYENKATILRPGIRIRLVGNDTFGSGNDILAEHNSRWCICSNNREAPDYTNEDWMYGKAYAQNLGVDFCVARYGSKFQVAVLHCPKEAQV